MTARKRHGHGLVKGSPDEPRDDHGRWTSGGSTSDQVTHGEGQRLFNAVDNAGLVNLGDQISSGMDDLQSQIDEAEAAEAAGGVSNITAEEANAAVTEEQKALRDTALALHVHLQAMAKASADALKNYEAQLASAGIGSIKDAKRAARLAEAKALRASIRV